MKFQLDGLNVYFPYAHVYPEQLSYMNQLKKALDAKGHAVLEMPSGTGKTITLLSLLTSYLLQTQPSVRKIIYCTRTVEEMEKVMEEANILYHCLQQEKEVVDGWFLCIGLASRKHLCLNEQVVSCGEGFLVDGRCRSLTASWIREKAKNDPTIPKCSFYERLEMQVDEMIIPCGVYSLQDLRRWGEQNGCCPYFYSRRLLAFANLIVYSYHYLLDPKVSQLVSRELPQDAIVVFDEAHNIDNVCIEALSVWVNRNTIDDANNAAMQLAHRVVHAKGQSLAMLQQEYQNLTRGQTIHHGLTSSTLSVNWSEWEMAQPSIHDVHQTLEETVPPSIRKAEHFIAYLQSLIAYIKNLLNRPEALEMTHNQFLQDFSKECPVEVKSFRFTSDRLSSLLRTLEIGDWSRFRSLASVAEMITIASTYSSGFAIILEPFETKTHIWSPVLQLACLDASLAMMPVTRKFRNVIITSGTLSPLDFYPRMLNFRAAITASFNMSLNRRCVLPLIIGMGENRVLLTSKFNQRGELQVPKSYGRILIEISKLVPDGIVGFFPSYEYMELALDVWKENNVLDELQAMKLLFIETSDGAESSLALRNFRTACDIGRGAIFLSVARGKAAEGIDFDHHYGRCVLLFGMPFQYTESRELKARLRYLRERFQIMENDFLVFDAMRQAAQCAGRVIRNKSDYGIMVFADRRYARYDKLTKLPRWILQFLSEDQIYIDIDTALTKIKQFLLEMANQALII
ncbi:TFIIH basal transcription factor complex helicase XPD subunit [Galdieria sulphuraria]|nr:TFIIH basal transcription factor complex helicase XPD subunit [Galdieria sulphuraria]